MAAILNDYFFSFLPRIIYFKRERETELTNISNTDESICVIAGPD